MGFFSKLGAFLGGLVDKLIDWLGRAFRAFIKWLVAILEAAWYITILSILIAAYGYAAILYLIFYVEYGRIIVEFWNPQQRSQPSKCFDLGEAKSNTPLPTRGDTTPIQATMSYQN